MSYTDAHGSMIIGTDEAEVSATPARNETDHLKLTVANTQTLTGHAYLTADDARELGYYLTDWANGHA